MGQIRRMYQDQAYYDRSDLGDQKIFESALQAAPASQAEGRGADPDSALKSQLPLSLQLCYLPDEDNVGSNISSVNHYRGQIGSIQQNADFRHAPRLFRFFNSRNKFSPQQ